MKRESFSVWLSPDEVSPTPIFISRCPALKEWGDAWPDIQEHMQAIIAQGRPLLTSDYAFLERVEG